MITLNEKIGGEKMNKEIEMTDKEGRYKFKRDNGGMINPRSHNSFQYKGEVLSIQKNLKHNRYSINIFKKGSSKNEGEFKCSQISLSEEELLELHDVIKELIGDISR